MGGIGGGTVSWHSHVIIVGLLFLPGLQQVLVCLLAFCFYLDFNKDQVIFSSGSFGVQSSCFLKTLSEDCWQTFVWDLHAVAFLAYLT